MIEFSALFLQTEEYQVSSFNILEGQVFTGDGMVTGAIWKKLQRPGTTLGKFTMLSTNAHQLMQHGKKQIGCNTYVSSRAA